MDWRAFESAVRRMREIQQRYMSEPFGTDKKASLYFDTRQVEKQVDNMLLEYAREQQEAKV